MTSKSSQWLAFPIKACQLAGRRNDSKGRKRRKGRREKRNTGKEKLPEAFCSWVKAKRATSAPNSLLFLRSRLPDNRYRRIFNSRAWMPRSARPFLSQLTRQFLTVPVNTAVAFSPFVFVRNAALPATGHKRCTVALASLFHRASTSL